MGSVLYVTAEVIRQIAILAQAYMPQSAEKLLDALSVDAQKRQFSALGEEGRLKSGGVIAKPEPVFPRYVEPETDA